MHIIIIVLRVPCSVFHANYVLDRGATRSLLGSLSTDETREEETDQARGDEEDDAEDDDDACFSCGPVLLALGELVEGAGGDGGGCHGGL